MVGIAVHSGDVKASPAQQPAPGSVAAASASAPRQRGPLVAVCGLCGGAGASLLTYLLAAWSLSSGSRARVLVLDAGAGTAGLSLHAGISSSRSLVELVEDVHAGTFIGQAFGVATGGLHVLATEPRGEPAVSSEALTRVLDDARRAHHLAVADCGTATTITARLVLESASHVIWMLPATGSGVARASVVLQSKPELDGAEVLVARGDATTRRPPNRALAGLASLRRAPLVLMPHVPALTERADRRAAQGCAGSLEAIRMALRL
jgi:hypothetical protein